MHSVVAYRALVERLEQQAARQPQWYRFKLAALALLGYAVLVLAIALALALSLGLGLLLLLSKSVWAIKLIKFVWIPLLLAWLILRALWVRIAEPGGHRLQRGEAPELEAEIERLRVAAGAPRLCAIIIDDELNAAAVSVPRLLGLLGSRHYLVLGLPLLRGMQPDEVAAVVAHEFGHFQGGHARFAGRIYRVRASWYQLLESLQAEANRGSALFVRFFRWYAPYFNAYSFVLARDNEYEADRVAARLVGAAAMGRALARVHVLASRLHERFWPQVERLNLIEAQPPQALYADMQQVLQAADDAESDERALHTALQRRTDLSDTHPGLSQRLAALSTNAGVPAPISESAAQRWLGPLADTLQLRFDAEWLTRATPVWTQRYEAHAAERQRLAELQALRETRALDVAETMDYALLNASFHPEQPAVPLFEAVLALDPEHAGAHFQLGVLYLETDAARGIEHLETAMQLSDQAIAPALEAMARHHAQAHDDVALDAVLVRFKAWERRQQQDDIERRRVSGSDVYEPHGLDAAVLAAVRELLGLQRGVGKAWLVRKRIVGSQMPHFVLLVRWRRRLKEDPRILQEVLAQQIQVPGTALVLSAGYSGRAERRIRKVAGMPVLQRRWNGKLIEP